MIIMIIMTAEKKTNYLLRDIPPMLWKAARLRALKESISMREVIERLLERYVRKGLE
jgi:hypothetical protein